MKFIGNYNSWIQQEWIDFIMSNEGFARPSNGRNPISEEFKQAESVGYDLSKTYWYIFEPDMVPFTIKSPFPVDGNFLWWFIKMLPGNMMPMHKDPHAINEDNSKRYWMPLQDYEPGHVFIYKNKLIVDYKKGDLYQYEDSRALHGACNIGWSPRIIINFSTYDSNNNKYTVI
jgi:hypothetical protein